MKRILVTGSNGFIGSHLVDMLLEDGGNEVHGMVLEGTDESNLEGAKIKDNFKVVYADLTKLASLEAACEGIELIYHLAALAVDWASKEAFMKIILDGTKNMVEAALKKGVKRLVYMSSLVVHGFNGHRNANEETPIDPIPFFPYAIAKAEVEKYLAGIRENSELETVVIRPGFDIIGPRDTYTFYKMALNMEKGRFGFIDGGEKLVSLVNVKNLVAGLIHAGNLDSAAGETYIISDDSWTWKRYAEELAKRLDCKVPGLNVKYGLVAPFIRFVEFFYKIFKAKKSPILNRYRISVPRDDLDFVSEKIRAAGFKPPFTLEDGLDDAVAWYKKIKEEKA